MSTTQLRSELNTYFAQLTTHLPEFSLEDQHTALAIYRELAKGGPVDGEQMSSALDIGLAEARTRLARPALKGFTYLDPEGRIIGFGGLATVPMPHEFVVNGQLVWTWCAWDSLFIPELLGAPAEVASPDPRTQTTVRLSVAPDGVRRVEPEEAVVSFVRTDADMFADSAENVMGRFCHYVFFFESRSSGEAWIAEHPDTFLCSLDEAVTLARRLNARNFGQALGRT